jgi:hypothetical protein
MPDFAFDKEPGPLTHLVILRVAATDPEGDSIEARIAFDHLPNADDITELEGALADQYLTIFGSMPERTGYGLFPFVASIDDPDEDDDRNYQAFEVEREDSPEWDAGWPPQ